MGLANPQQPRKYQLEEGKAIVLHIRNQAFLSSQFWVNVVIQDICKNCPVFVQILGFQHKHKGPCEKIGTHLFVLKNVIWHVI